MSAAAFVRRAFGPEGWNRTPCGGPEVWTIPLDDPRVLALGRAALPPEEEAAGRRFVSSTLADRYVAAHGALRLLLGRWLGCGPREICFFRNACGKPFVRAGRTSAFPMRKGWPPWRLSPITRSGWTLSG